MAHARHVVVLALVMFSIIGLACASDALRFPDQLDHDYVKGNSDFRIGTVRGPDSDDHAPSPKHSVVAPIGGPVPPGALASTPTTPPPGPSAASSFHHLSAIVGTAAIAATVGFFYF